MDIREIHSVEELPYDLLAEADPSREAVDDYTRRGKCYGAYDSDDRLVGVCVLLRTRPFTMEVVNLAVHADFQHQGIGKSLIEYAKHKSRSERCSVLEVGTANAGTGQLAFYQKCGFEIDGIDRDFFRRNYPEPIFENGIECRHMVRLRIEL
ncbi:MAG TPA: GNAT family N-acetyltransferase [Candidatus Alistipes pullicola]|nr:GNAT family N-acetyltransferase [Candidatus Alistipes pullicola]